MNDKSCGPSHVGQAGQEGKGGQSGAATKADECKPTGQSGTGQSDHGHLADPAAPEDYDSDPQGGGGKLDQVVPE